MLRTVRMTDSAPGINPIFRQMMQPLHAASLYSDSEAASDDDASVAIVDSDSDAS